MKKTIGDRHNGKAAELIEQSGRKYIRKPRSAQTERAWEAFLREIEREGFFCVPHCVRIICESADSHEVEIVENTPAKGEKDIEEYFLRCGALIFFCYLLGSTDLHAENIIACGGSPIVVDLETMLSGEIRERGEKKQYSLANSVFASHLLPNWAGDTDCGGITGSISAEKNKLHYGGKTIEPYNHTEEILRGFSKAYDFALEHKSKLFELIGLFGSCRFRVLLRPTQTYSKILDTLKICESSSQREQFAAVLLGRAYKKDIDSNRICDAKKALSSEISAVVSGDVPLFYTLGSGTALCDFSGEIQKNFLSLSPVEAARRRLTELDSEDKLSQMRLVEQSLTAIRPRTEFIKKSSTSNAMNVVFESIEQAYIPRLPSGRIMLDAGADGNIYLQSTGLGLYDGAVGIMCSYAAIYRKTESQEVLTALEHIFDRYAEFIEQSLPVKLTEQSASLQDGVGGHIAALIHISSLIQDGRFADFAQRIASSVDFCQKNEYTYFDILNGISGLALSADALGLPLAQHLADSLSGVSPILTGAAHGAAGIALALGKLQTALGDSRFDKQILDLLKWENEYFDSDCRNWSDLRRNKLTDFMCGWCSGAPGIAMARNALINCTNNSDIISICRKNTAAFIDSISAYAAPKRDSLCCGSAARLMAASSIGAGLPEIRAELEQRAADGNLRLFTPNNSCFENPGLMQGLAGIGYALATYGESYSGGMLL